MDNSDEELRLAHAEYEEALRKAAFFSTRAEELAAFIKVRNEFRSRAGEKNAKSGGAKSSRDSASTLVIVSASKELLSARGHLKTDDLIKLLAGKGIQIGGSNPKQKLSQILSRKDDIFLPDRTRKKGWALTKAARKDEASNAANGAGLGAHTSGGVPS